MDQKQLNAIKERVVKVTPGPWICDQHNDILTQREARLARTITRRDAEFIANAREDVPALVAEVERLQKRLEQTEKCYEIMEKATFKATDKMICFKKALEFYANENNHFRVDMHAESIVMQDECKIARQALGGEAHE